MREKVTFIHFSDAHLDLYYEEGTYADCGDNYCCRSECAPGLDTVFAGKWGAPHNTKNNCDIPMITFQNALQQIKATTGYSDAYLFWTGDNTAHDDPWVNQTEITTTLETIISEVQATFADKMDETFVCLGNHDSFPNG